MVRIAIRYFFPVHLLISPLEDLEPYDEVLDRRLWVHFQEGLTWQSTLATRRRDEPIKAEALMQDLFMREREWEMEDTPPMLDIEGKDTKAVKGTSGSLHNSRRLM